MRVVMLLPGLQRTGPVISVYELTRQLLVLGISVDALVLARHDGDSMQSDFQRLRVPVHTLSASKYNWPCALVQLRRFLAACDAEIIHSALIRPDFFLGVLRATRALKRRRPMLITTVRSRPEEEARFRMGRIGANLLIKAWAQAWNQFDVIVPLGQGIHDSLVTCKIPTARVETINNGVDTFDFCPPNPARRKASRATLGFLDDDIVLGSTSRLVNLKALHLVLHAMADIGPAAKLKYLAVGSGPEGDALKSLSAQLGLERQVLWAGEHRDIRRFLHAMDVFVLPSLTEGSPSGLLEAGACGLPVVVSDIPGCRDAIVHGETGFLFPPGDVAELTAAIERMAADHVLRRRLGTDLRARIELNFSAAQIAKRYEMLYRTLLARSSP